MSRWTVPDRRDAWRDARPTLLASKHAACRNTESRVDPSLKTEFHMTRFALSLAGWLLAASLLGAANKPLSLHPANPHYFLFRGKPTVLISSGEHYGAVLNLDFDYVKYLETLRGNGLNLTRTFTGAYVEPPGAFNIASNTLAPAEGRFVCPWARS